MAFPREETTHAEVDYQKRAWGVCGLGKAEKVGLGEAGEWLELEGGWTAKGQVKVLREFGLLSNEGRKELNGSAQQEREGPFGRGGVGGGASQEKEQMQDDQRGTCPGSQLGVEEPEQQLCLLPGIQIPGNQLWGMDQWRTRLGP